MKKIFNKALALVLVVVMVIAVMPVAFADEAGNDWDVSMEMTCNYAAAQFPNVGALPWWPTQGWVGNGGGGDGMSIATSGIPASTPSIARAGRYNMGSSMRGGQANFHVPISSNYRVTFEMDWYPGIPAGTGNNSYGKLAIQDDVTAGFSNSGGTQDNQFINFITSSASGNTGLYYVIGNILDSTQYRVGGSAGSTSGMAITDARFGERHQIGTSSIARNTWYTISLDINFQDKTIGVTFKNRATGAILVDNAIHPFPHQTPETSPFRNHPTNENGTPIERDGIPVEFKKQVASFRFVNASNWTDCYFTNVKVQGLIPYVPPVLTGTSNLNPARGTFDLTIAPYTAPAGTTLQAINVFAATDGGPAVQVATLPGAGVHSISVPRGNATHVITAEAVVDGTVTNRSNALTVVHAGVTTPKPATVDAVDFVVVNGKIDLTWDAVENADEYIIYRAFFARSSFERIGKVDNATSFSDINARLTPTAHTYYRIEAIGDGGSGGLSDRFASSLSGYELIEREAGMKDRGLAAVNLAGDKGAEILVTAAGPDGEPLTSGVFLSWRWFNEDDNLDTKFTLFRNGVAIATDLTLTNLVDPAGGPYDIYRIEGSTDAQQDITAPDIRVWSNFYQEFQLYRPPFQTMANGIRHHFGTNDMTIADLNGDGTYDLIVKWVAGGVDASIGGQTGTTIFDAYKVDWNTGETVLLWRIDLGIGARSGSHFTQFGAADYLGRGNDQLMIAGPTSTRSWHSLDGTDQTLVMNPGRVGNGSIPANAVTSGSGMTHVALICGLTGDILQSVTGQNSLRNNGAVAYVRGHDQRPSFIMAGQYGGAWVREYRVNDAGTLIVGWQGSGTANHDMKAGDLHGQGFDSVILGASILVPNAARTNFMTLNTVGVHGDASHLSNWIYDPVRFPDLPNGYPRQFLMITQENPGSGNGRYSALTRDALTAELVVAWNSAPADDIGRGAVADIDPTSKNAEMWATNGPRTPIAQDGNWNLRTGGVYGMETYGVYASNANNDRGFLTKLSDVSPSMNFTLFWTGDLLSEMQCHDFNEQVGYVPINTNITKWDYLNNREIFMFLSDEVYTINGTKGNPNLQVDILGDWREEVIFRNANDESKVRMYMTTLQTDYVLPWLMEDHNYNIAIQWQQSTYNQPPNTSYLPSREVITARGLDYYTLTAETGLVMTYEPANDGSLFGFEITGHQLWRKDGGKGVIDLTPRGTLSNSTRIQLTEAGYTLVGYAEGNDPIVDATAIVGEQYSYVVIGEMSGKLSYIGHPLTITIEDRSNSVTVVEVVPTEALLTSAGATVQLSANALPENSQNRNVIWASLDENVATVDSTGRVTAVGNGTTKIFAISAMSPHVAGISTITVAVPTHNVAFLVDDAVFTTRVAFTGAAMGDAFPLDPYKAGNVFAGWFNAGGTRVTATSVIPASTDTLYARFTPTGEAKSGDRWQFNITAPTPVNPRADEWIVIPINSNPANGTSTAWPATTPLFASSKAQAGTNGPFWGMTSTVQNTNSDNAGGTWTTAAQNLVTRGNVVENNSWFANSANAAGLRTTDRFGNEIVIPREVIAGYALNFGFMMDLPNGAYDVIAIFGDSRQAGGTTRGSLIFHNEPAEISVARTSNAANAENQRVMASREAPNPAMNNPSIAAQNAQNGFPTTVAINHYPNVMVNNGFLSVETAGFNLGVQAYIIVTVVSFAPIEAAISEVAKLNPADFSATSWAAVMAAVRAAQAAMLVGGGDNEPHNQAEIDAFALAIDTAIEELVDIKFGFEIDVTEIKIPDLVIGCSDSASINRAIEVTVTNTGNTPTGGLEIKGLGEYFRVVPLFVPSIPAGESATFVISPTSATREVENLPTVFSAELVIGNAKAGEKIIPVTFAVRNMTDAEFLQARASDILRSGLGSTQLILTANNKANLILVLDGREYVIATNVNNRNVSGRFVLPDGSGTLIFDFKGNGSNIKEFRII